MDISKVYAMIQMSPVIPDNLLFKDATHCITTYSIVPMINIIIIDIYLRIASQYTFKYQFNKTILKCFYSNIMISHSLFKRFFLRNFQVIIKHDF